MDELVALYIAYTVIWAGLFGYMAYMHMVQAKLARELKLLKELVKKKKCNLGIATDCDGDRFGVIDERGKYVDPNIVLSLILDYFVTQKGWRGGVARSVATTHLIDRIARRYDLPLYKTPVGFKYLAELFLEDKIIFGGEESACLVFKDGYYNTPRIELWT